MSSGTRTPTGTVTSCDGAPHLLLTRTYRGAPEDVWAAVTYPERLSRWFGDWRGDPGTGRIEIAMRFDGVPFEPYVIDACDPPRHLRLHSVNADPTRNWTLDLRLDADTTGTTTLELAQLIEAHTDITDVGPGWEYQLDRLEALLAGDDATAVTFDETHESLAEYYRGLR